MNTKKNVVSWPGWSLKENKFGKEFDAEARVRMIVTGRKILPYLLENSYNLGKKYLEIGPFFTPIIFSEEFPDEVIENLEISFLENDINVIEWLDNTFKCNILDLNMNSESFTDHLKLKMKEAFNAHANYYDSVVISQIINYVDYKELFKSIFSILDHNGLVFVNNVVEYGIPVLFSEKRPKSNQEVIETAEAIGYKVKCQEELPKAFSSEPYSRLILILTKE